MRLNKFIAQATGISRRKADEYIKEGLVYINEQKGQLNSLVNDTDAVFLKGRKLVRKQILTIMLNKPVGYVCSRKGQGNQTIYDLLPKKYNHLKPVGRLDKDSSGLLLLTNDGHLANTLLHPRNQKRKEYEVRLDKELTQSDLTKITNNGIVLEDGLSKFNIELQKLTGIYKVVMAEGRNRQIRRTFAALGYRVLSLQRTSFGKYELNGLKPGDLKKA